MKACAGNAREWLTALLAAGPVESARVKALAEQRGIGSRALRNAREALRVVATRHGSGVTMHSTWELPAGTDGRLTDGEVRDDAAKTRNAVEPTFVPPRDRPFVPLRFPKVSGPAERPRPGPAAPTEPLLAFQPSAESLNESKGFQGAAHPQAASSAALDLVLDNNELRRLERRVDLFVQRGLNPQEAGQVALALVGRDRHSGQAVGSCIECQNYVRQQCAVPQAPAVIHECWSRRHDGP